jgi:corrinoid protein of di/trimethylamine methyltransferase
MSSYFGLYHGKQRCKSLSARASVGSRYLPGAAKPRKRRLKRDMTRPGDAGHSEVFAGERKCGARWHMPEALFEAMRQSIIDGAADTARSLAETGMQSGMAPLLAIQEGYVPGMSFVGEEFGHRRMFLPDMMASAEAMKAAMSVLEPELKRMGTERPSAGTVVLGTAKGDIHEIGKTLVATLLGASGFRVLDLGVDVSPERFVSVAREVGADVVGVSALLTTTMKGQKSVVELFDREGLRPRVKVIVGGAPVTRQWAEEIHADGFAKDAMSAVSLVQRVMAESAVGHVVEQG